MSLNGRQGDLQRTLAVNNVAVTHLERGQYLFASDAMQTSMMLMKSIVGAMPGVERRCGKTSDPSRTNVSCATGESETPELARKYQDSVQAVPFNICVRPFHIQTLPTNPSMSQVFPLCFEADQDSFSSIAEDLNRLSLDIVSAVLLYNLALINLMEAKGCGSSFTTERRGRHLKFARSLLDVAMKIISFDCAEEEASLPLAILLVNGMYQVLVELGDYLSASLAADDFYQLQRVYQHDWMAYDEDEWNMNDSSCPSAAAA